MAFTTYQYQVYPTYSQVLLEGDEFLAVTPAGAIYASNGTDGVISHGVGGNSEVDVDGYVAGFDAIAFAINDVNNAVRVGADGHIVAAHIGVLFDSENTGPTNDLLDSAGEISGALSALLFHGDNNTAYNSGRMSGNVVVELQSGSDDTIQNSAGGVMTGQRIIHSLGLGTKIVNHGEMLASANGAKAIDMEGANATVVNDGNISGGSSVVYYGSSGAILRNFGTLEAAQNFAVDSNSLNVLIVNDGDISAQDNTINLDNNAGGSALIRNALGGKIMAVGGTGTAIVNALGSTVLRNSGVIGGAVRTAGASLLVNKGDMNGDVTFTGASQTVRNTGNIAGEVLLQSAGDDLIVNYAGGVIDSARGLGIAQTAAGGFMRVVNAGQISGGVVSFEQARLVNTGTIIDDIGLGSQATVVNKGTIDGNVSFANTLGNYYNGAGGHVTGTIFGRGSDGRYVGGDFDENFDLTNTSAKRVFGGGGDDNFRFTAAGFTSKVTVIGGEGDDSLTFSNAGVFNRSAFTHASGIETINLASGTNVISVPEALALSAADSTLSINGNAGADTINVLNFISSASKVKMYGGGGRDSMVAGGSTDTFVYTATTDSTGPNYDTITSANLSVDRFEVSPVVGNVNFIGSAVTTGALSTTTFNADMAAALTSAQLFAKGAVLFTPNSGTLSGQTFLVVDANGFAGYQANSDLVIALSNFSGTLTGSTFV